MRPLPNIFTFRRRRRLTLSKGTDATKPFLLNLLMVPQDRDLYFKKSTPGAAMAENTNHWRKFHCMADLLCDWFGFDQTS